MLLKNLLDRHWHTVGKVGVFLLHRPSPLLSAPQGSIFKSLTRRGNYALRLHSQGWPNHCPAEGRRQQAVSLRLHHSLLAGGCRWGLLGTELGPGRFRKGGSRDEEGQLRAPLPCCAPTCSNKDHGAPTVCGGAQRSHATLTATLRDRHASIPLPHKDTEPERLV